MTFLHSIIKIKYINQGYLPNYPYYLISDAEMFEAFLKEDGFFADFYPCPSDDLQSAYDTLLEAIQQHIDDYLNDETAVPNWVYEYMIMSPTTYESDHVDIEYLYELEGIDPPVSAIQFSPELAEACYATSDAWIKKLPSKYGDRPPTMFGEAHVLKSLRLDQANILLDVEAG